MKQKLFRIFLLITILSTILAGCYFKQETTGTPQSTPHAPSSPSTQTDPDQNSKIGDILEEYESTMHFISYSPEGTVTAEFDGTANAALYENLSGDMDYVGYLKADLAFDTDDYRFQATLPDSPQGCYYIANHRVCSLVIYDRELGCWSYQEMALDMENGRIAILLKDQNENTHLYLLVGSADSNADPAELVAFFEDFIAHRWPQWWEQYNSAS